MLSVGRLFAGTVKSLHDEYSSDPSEIAAWEAEVRFLGSVITANGGGDWSRNQHMAWVEETIKEMIFELNEVLCCKPGRRIIKDSLCKLDRETMKFSQEVLEVIDE